MCYGASPEDWFNLDLVGLMQDLLPVVSNPNAGVSPNSKLKTIGKVPSRYNSQNQIVGIPDWTQHKTSPAELARWSTNEDYGICIQTRYLRAFDIDVTIPELVREIKNSILSFFPETVIRFRKNSCKILIPFFLAGDYAKRVLKTEHGSVEFLATGQQFVAIGTHTSGVRYEGLENVNAFPEITSEDFESLWSSLVSNFAIEPPSSSSLRNPSDNPEAGILAAMRDPIVGYLEARGHVTGLGKEGQVYLTCPFSEGHTQHLEGDTSTAYLPAGHRDYDLGHFACLHASCASRLDEDFLDAVGYRLADFDVLPPEVEVTDPPPIANRFPLVPFSEFANRKPPQWIVAGMIPRADLVVLYGSSGAGKSFIALDMAFAIVRGSAWNGKAVVSGRVVYIAAEGAGGFQKRVKAYMLKYSINGELPFQIIAGCPNLLLRNDAVDICKSILTKGKADFIIVDTFAQTTPGANENSAEDVGKALANIKGINTATGATVGLIHHAGKDETKGARGWSGLQAAADAVLEVSRNGDNARLLKVTKQKDGDDGEVFGFSLESLVIDDDGQTSCIVNYTTVAGGKNTFEHGFWHTKILEVTDKLGTPICEDVLRAQAFKFAGSDEGLPEGDAPDDEQNLTFVRATNDLTLNGELSGEDDFLNRPL